MVFKSARQGDMCKAVQEEVLQSRTQAQDALEWRVEVTLGSGKKSTSGLWACGRMAPRWSQSAYEDSRRRIQCSQGWEPAM